MMTLNSEIDTFYFTAIEKLRERYNKCIAVHGDYVEK